MKQVGGVWLPDHEEHLIEWMNHPKNKTLIDGKLAYQWKKQVLAMSFVRSWRTAVDVGAHCGLWSMHLAKRFQALHAFEPIAEHRECFVKNVAGETLVANVVLHDCALGEREGTCTMTTKNSSSGDSWVANDSTGDVRLATLDSFALQNVDFIKLDCEGYEYFALKGGEEMLKRCKPTVIVEQKPNRPKNFGLPQLGAVEYLQKLGAVLGGEISGDFILSWD